MPARADAGMIADADRRGWIDGLCTWRALLMLGGIVLHATIGHEGYPPFAAINMISNAFRMGVFFVISGLLGALAIQRRAEPKRWLRQRLVRLGVPTLFGLVVLCPLTALMLASGSIYPVGAMTRLPNLFHLWFMAALLLYTLGAYAFEQADRRHLWLERADRALASPRFARAAVPIATGALSFILAIAALRLGRTMPTWLAGPVKLTFGYAPLYAAGFAAARLARWRTAILYDTRLPVAMLAVIVAINILWWTDMGGLWARPEHRWLEELLIVGTAAWTPVAAAALILHSAMTQGSSPPLLQRLSDASFTIYILHYPVIVAVKVAIAPLMLGPWTEFALAVTVGGGWTFWFHEAWVTRSPVLMLLLNGQHGCAPAPRAAIA